MCICQGNVKGGEEEGEELSNVCVTVGEVVEGDIH